MTPESVIATLRSMLPTLRDRFGVRSLMLFGSVARGGCGPASDVDLLVEFDRPIGYFAFFQLQDLLEEALGRRVDLGTPDTLRPDARATALREAVRVA